ncbi:MAG: (d)CMP kinase [Bacteroidetes bacterium]|nr:(d)CMP kinase [Flavobacteriaceae bacterium]MDA0863674.1 (d)CMP kinase [Bacteroidota bacterium]MDA1209831.1 (d)CMP kinase [Bacteroidota bacterium]
MRRIIITIDGHSSTGKSTVAKQLAAELGYIYIDSGAMYRSVTLYAKDNELLTGKSLDKGALLEALPEIEIDFLWEHGVNKTILNGQDVSEHIRRMEISESVSQIATLPEVRAKMVDLQRSFGTKGGVVMDGRDIGSIVFPSAELKIFMTASAAVRAQRRHSELLASGQQVSYEAVLDNLQSRDEMDSKRSVSPLIIPEGAIVIDNSEMNPHDQFNMILQLAKDRIFGRV